MDTAEPHDRHIPPDKPGIGAHPAVCPVVGLGASAGGLEAFQNFLAAVTADWGHAYVLVQHLDPNHESMLAELLSRRTEMQVRQVTDGMPIEPNNVYLIPPNASLIVEKARLRLSDFSEPRGFRRPIDVFFRSLATDQGANAACVVLSGTGGDGTEGLRAVKEAGGLTIVQDPETAKYDGMPKNAVATGLVDKVLPVQGIPGAIRDYFDRGQTSVLKLPDVNDFLSRVCEELRNRLGHDFSQYKRTTMLRRVQRRMQVVGASNAEDYLSLLTERAAEAELLFRDLLINVTCFFRDAEAFDFLRREVIPELLKGKGASDTIRIWSPGCSSGEEAYSLAILMAEALSRRRDGPSVQIFATDIDEAMLQKARAARYPHSAMRDVPIELVDRYFYSNDDDYVVVQAIRDMVRISNHNLIKDPPFSRCDLILCRNLLIYLNGHLQQRLLPVFHYALKKDGWLFLGTAENIAGRNDLFETVESSAKIYRRRGGARQSVTMPLQVQTQLPQHSRQSGVTASERGDEISRRIMEGYAPAHVVVDADNNVTHVSTRTGKYLELAAGTPTNRIADLTRRGLRSAVRSVLDTARRTSRRTVKNEVRIDSDDPPIFVDVSAEKLSGGDMLVVFRDTSSASREPEHDADVNVDDYTDEQRIRELEDELGETKTRLTTTVEELETSNEELKSSNEEMMSMNEELQSTNEELATVNEELKNKVEQLARANSDLQNFIESTQIPTIFLDRKMRIRSFTPAIRSLFRFQEQDRGRPFSDVVSRADQKQLEAIARRVLKTGESIEEELTIDPNERYVLRVLPYRNVAHTVDGVVLVFTDVSKIRQTQTDLALNVELVRQRSHEIETLYQTATVGMALVDRNRRVLKINQLFADLNGAPIEDHIGRSLNVMTPVLAARLDRPIEEVFESGTSVTDLDVSLRSQEGKLRDFLIDSYPYEEEERTTAVGIVVKDVTEIRRLEKELRRLMDELQHRVKNTLAIVSSVVNQTALSGKSVPEMIDTLKKRVGALAATHHLLTSKDWREVSLEDILQTELKPFDDRDRISWSGPDVALSPKHALTLTMTFHELATNAAKYGAIGSAGGRLSVTWAVMLTAVGRTLTIAWKETGVDGLKHDRSRQSFGTRLIKNAVPHDLGGRCAYALEKDGVQCTLEVPF